MDLIPPILQFACCGSELIHFLEEKVDCEWIRNKYTYLETSFQRRQIPIGDKLEKNKASNVSSSSLLEVGIFQFGGLTTTLDKVAKD